MDKPIVFTKHFHSCFASFSSNDTWIEYKTLKSKCAFPLAIHSIIDAVGMPIHLEKISEIHENPEIIEVYVENDKTYYDVHNVRYHATKEEMKKLMTPYLEMGWSIKPSGCSEYDKETDRLERELRKRNGYINYDYKDKEKYDMQGGFSDIFFNDKHLQDYIKNGGVFGYIGNSDRTYNSDHWMESVALRHSISPRELGVYMCSTRGRHFADDMPTNFNEFETALLNEIKSAKLANWWEAEMKD